MGLLIDLQPDAGPALVVGGGAVAARKVRNLAEAEFEIVLVAPIVLDEIRAAPFITVHEREFADADLSLRAFSVVFACTDSRAVNERIGQLARLARIPVVVADAASESTFFTPATLRQGEVSIAVSTGGASPGLARMLRESIVAALGPRLTAMAFQAGQEKAARAERRARALEERQQ
jgi:siroheme synthase-like protein